MICYKDSTVSKSCRMVRESFLIGGCFLFLISFICLVPAPADACTPPPQGWQNLRMWDDNSEMPAGGAVVFSVVDGGGEHELTISVSTESGEEVQGSHQLIERGQERISPRWINCPYEDGLTSYLVVWSPESQFSVGSEYQVEVIARNAYHLEDLLEERAIRNFGVVADESVEFIGPEISQVSLQAVVSGKDFQCCTCSTCCGLCPSDDGRDCWYVSETVRPGVNALIQPQVAALEHQLLYRVFDNDEIEVDTLWGPQTKDALVAYSTDHQGPYCLRIEVESLRTGEILAIEESCAENTEGLVFGVNDLPPYWSAECDEDPVDEVDEGNDDTGHGGLDAGYESNDTAGAGDEGNSRGCSISSGGGFPSTPILLLLSLLLLSNIGRRKQ